MKTLILEKKVIKEKNESFEYFRWELFHVFLSSADLFVLFICFIYFTLFFFCFYKNTFFSRRNQNKKIKQLQSSPDQTLFVQSDLGPNCMLMLSVGNDNSKKYP